MLSIAPPDAKKLVVLHLQFLSKQYDMPVVPPMLPVSLPPFLGAESFNPINQFSVQDYLKLPEIGSVTNLSKENDNCLNNVFMGEFSGAYQPLFLSQ